MAISNDPAAQGWSGTVELSDAWTLSAGFHVEPPHELFSLFNVHVKGLGARLGVSFQRLFDAKPDAGVLDPYLALGDLVIVLGDEGESEQAAGAPVEVKSKSGKPTTIVVNGVGWKFGEKALRQLLAGRQDRPEGRRGDAPVDRRIRLRDRTERRPLLLLQWVLAGRGHAFRHARGWEEVRGLLRHPVLPPALADPRRP